MWNSAKKMLQEKPRLLHLGAFLSAVSFVLWLQIKPYGVLFTLILTFWMYKTKCPNMTIIPPLTISSNFEKTYKRFIQMRQDQPRLCCTIISAVLVALAVLGHIVSGSSIVVFGLLMAALIFSRHKITFLEKIVLKPPSEIQSTDPEVDEFLPEVNETNLFVLQNAGEKAVLLTLPQQQYDDDQDRNDELEIPPELLIPSIPEIEEHSDSSSDDECLISPAVASNETRRVGGDIEFQSGYFNQNSSSSDDDSITRGLSFRDVDLVDRSQQSQYLQQSKTVAGVPLSSSSPTVESSFPVPNLVAGLVSWGTENLIKNKLTQAVQQQLASSVGKHSEKRQIRRSSNSSDDSEFEILNHDELNQS